MMNNPLMGMYQQMRQNPVGMLSQRFNIPSDINTNDPQAIIEHLLNTQQISQAQVNNIMRMRNNPIVQMLMSMKR